MKAKYGYKGNSNANPKVLTVNVGIPTKKKYFLFLARGFFFFMVQLLNIFKCLKNKHFSGIIIKV